MTRKSSGPALFKVAGVRSKNSDASGIFRSKGFKSLPRTAQISTALVYEGVKPAGEIECLRESARDVSRITSRLGIYYAQAQYLPDIPTVYVRVPSAYFLISKRERVLRELVEWASRGLATQKFGDEYHSRMGALFGYPNCCIEEFVKRIPDWRFSRIGQDCQDTKNCDFVFHFPCSPECEGTRSLLRKSIVALERRNLLSEPGDQTEGF